ncbi:hypothetical protein COY07_06170 [Candidatus Peregrinibacteria bacterium CG_4_10_14_0_2_um_filter_43_11]|nr:MAG: hypothetical protein COY07_06170 [Candidatus Peregrinibacteria bacterium CG_4_10_14_0_2_um_filter_43_11]
MPAKLKRPKAVDKFANAPLIQHAKEVFDKIKSKTGLSQKKVDQFQKDWLAMPKTRTKYGSLKDAPAVVSEELIAMSNDIIEFIQRQESGHSLVFNKLKAELSEMRHHPVHFFKAKFEKAKAVAKTISETAKKTVDVLKDEAKQARAMAEKGSEAMKNMTGKVQKKVPSAKKKAKK